MQTLPEENNGQKPKDARPAFDPFNNLKIAHKGIVLVAVPLLTGLIAVGVLLWLLDRSDRELKRESRVRQIHALTTTFQRTAGALSVNAASYAFRKEQKYKDSYKANLQISDNAYQQLGELLKDNPEELNALQPAREDARRIREVGKMIMPETEFKDLRHHVNMMKIAEARMTFQRALRDSNRDVAAFLRTIDRCENVQLLDPVAGRERVRTSVTIFALLTLLVSASLAVFFSRSITSRLKIIMDNAVLLAARSPLHPNLTGRDEIAKLDQVFHQMSSEIVEAGTRARAITDNAIDVICAIDAGKRFVEINPACLKSWGFQPEELIGKRFVDIIATDDVDKTVAAFNQATGAGANITAKNKLQKKDGSIADMQWSLNWSPEKKTYYCIVHDITKREEIERLKRDFVSMVSHDLRTPLTSLRSALALFENGTFGTLNERGNQTVKKASDNLARLINLIDSLLDIEKMEAGKMQMNMEVLDVAQVALRSVDAVAYLAETNGIAIKCQSSHLEGFGDASKLIQVVVNLLSNAIKFSPKGSTIEISYLDTDDYFELRVKDEGRGIPESHLSKIFSRFEQVESADHSKKGGKGLGLAICKSIIEGHGGTIEVVSQPGQGSTFWFRIPHPQ